MPAEVSLSEDPITLQSLPEDRFRLARFVAVLALDRERLLDFLADLESGTETTMEAAGLNFNERSYLTAESFRDLCHYLWQVGEPHRVDDYSGAEPSPDEDTGDG